jgi:hypothetical protein
MMKASLATVSGLLLASTASAATITFDEFAYDNDNGAIPAGRYAALGVTFVGTDDGSTWGGNSNGNPGNWGLEGTNGAGFSGFNGNSNTQTLTFAGPLSFFSLDASRSNGSQDGTITLEAYNGATLVATTSANFGAINVWTTLSVAGTFDRVVYTGTGTGFHPFGVDNLNWRAGNPVPEPATWALMIAGFGMAGMGLRRRATLRLA